MKFGNWKTTMAGLLGAIATGVVSAIQQGGVPTKESLVTASVLATMGYLSKDK